ncbi:protein containg PAS domain S-box [Longilinea arvoryzae]|uniref:Protein containg PAS domain S-box n=1 Tax=Longilinea arvoryzae TaxID=360412 RepID=A0A0S7B8R9_9CHLR|nr:histidine kinase N-terminal 7TM domain-containing protein [Longilinea arvoryzae]GAP13751.1 protein containg PAS domain S-box [Longilinea arvoryzae]
MVLFVLPLFISAIITGGLAWYSGSYHCVPGVREFRLSLLITSIWSLFYAFELLLPTVTTKLVASSLGFTAVAALPVPWLATVMKFTGRGNQFKRYFPFILIIPVFTIAAVWSNPLHHLFIQRVSLDVNDLFPIMKEQYGPLFWVHTSYTYFLYVLAAGFLVRLLAHSSRRYIGQPLTMLIGMLIPLVWNVMYVTDILPNQRLDLTPYLYSISGIFLLLGLVYARLFDILPVARDVVMDAICDAVIVLDFQNRVVDLNFAARKVFGWPSETQLISQPFKKIFAPWPAVMELLGSQRPQRTELVLERDQELFYYQATLSLLNDSQGNSLGMLLMLHDNTDSKLMEQDLRRLTVTDPLTELGNRRKFFNALDSEFTRAKRYHHVYSLVMLDLDNYKSINDRYTHLVGDEALRMAANAMRRTVRKTDTVARYGGDEFVALLPNTQEEGALQLAQRLRDAIHDCQVSENEHLTASLGVAVYWPEDQGSEDLLARADLALYQAKEEMLGIVLAEKHSQIMDAAR